MSWTLLCFTLKYVMNTSLLYLKICHGHFLLQLKIRHGHFLAVPYNLSSIFPSFALKYARTISLQTVFNLLPISSRRCVFAITTTHWLDSPSFGPFRENEFSFFKNSPDPLWGPPSMLRNVYRAIFHQRPVCLLTSIYSQSYE